MVTSRQRFQRSWVGLTSERNIYMAKKALQYIKSKLTEFRSEERRKILRHMQAPEDVDHETYIRHLAIFRKFVRLCENHKSATYSTFRQWLGSSQNIDEEMWGDVMEEDESFDYKNLGSSCHELEGEATIGREETIEQGGGFSISGEQLDD